MQITFKKALVLVSLISNLGVSKALAEHETVIHQAVTQRTLVDIDGIIISQNTELFEVLENGEDCAAFDTDGEYDSYLLETVTQSPSQRNAAAFTQWFEGKKTDHNVTSVTIQTCLGITL